MHVEVETWIPRDGTMTVLKLEEVEAYINQIDRKDNKHYINVDEARQKQSNETGCSASRSLASHLQGTIANHNENTKLDGTKKMDMQNYEYKEAVIMKEFALAWNVHMRGASCSMLWVLLENMWSKCTNILICGSSVVAREKTTHIILIYVNILCFVFRTLGADDSMIENIFRTAPSQELLYELLSNAPNVTRESNGKPTGKSGGGKVAGKQRKRTGKVRGK